MVEKVALFIYGTLLDPKIQQLVIGMEMAGVQAELCDYCVKTAAGRLFPFAQKQKGEWLSGLVFNGVTAAQLAAIDFYLDNVLFARSTSVALVDGQKIAVQLHMPTGKMSDDGSWDFAVWQQRQQPAALRAALQIMRSFPVVGPHNTPINHHGIDMRAFSNLRAATGSAPVQLRRGFGVNDVESLSRLQPYAGYFGVEDMEIRHARFDGGRSEVLHRSVYLAADAVTVLPYDPVSDQVLMVEQFRPAAFARDDTNPWVLEPVAGRCDAGEPVELVAKRELMEEAGLTLLHLEKIGSYYSSPGCLTEYLYSFVGIVDLAGENGRTHGLEAEGEDILTHILPFEAAMDTLQTGEADNGPLIMSLLWLQANRTRLQKTWGGA